MDRSPHRRERPARNWRRRHGGWRHAPTSSRPADGAKNDPGGGSGGLRHQRREILHAGLVGAETGCARRRWPLGHRHLQPSPVRTLPLAAAMAAGIGAGGPTPAPTWSAEDLAVLQTLSLDAL